MMTEDQINWLSDDEMDFHLDLGPSFDIKDLWRVIEDENTLPSTTITQKPLSKKILPKTPKSFSGATTPLSPPPGFPARDTCTVHEESKVVGMKSTTCSRKRPLKQLTCVQPGRYSRKKRPCSILGAMQEHASISSFHLSEASIKAKECERSPVAQSRLDQANTSPAMESQSRLISEVKTEMEDVGPDNIQVFSGEGPARTTGIQGRVVSPSIQEGPHTTDGARCDHKTKKNADLNNQQTCSIDADFLQQVVVAFEEANTNKEESARLVKKAFSIKPNLEATFLAILKKQGDITNGCCLESGYMLTSILEVICNVVQELQKKHLNEVDCNLLNSYYLVVRDAEKMKVNVNWLRNRLDEIKDAVESIVETKKLNDEKNKRVEQIKIKKKDLDSMKAELKKLKSEVELKESLLNIEAQVIEELSSKINERALRIQQFQKMPLMEPFL